MRACYCRCIHDVNMFNAEISDAQWVPDRHLLCPFANLRKPFLSPSSNDPRLSDQILPSDVMLKLLLASSLT